VVDGRLVRVLVGVLVGVKAVELVKPLKFVLEEEVLMISVFSGY